MPLGKFRMRVAGVLMATAMMGFGAPSAGLAETPKLGGTGGALGTMDILGAAFAEANPGVTQARGTRVRGMPFVLPSSATGGDHPGNSG